MASGETLLKFTDYPFAYTLIGIILGGLGFTFNQNPLLFLGLAGGFGSLLTLSDPIGRFIRRRAVRRINMKYTKIKEKKEPTTIDFMKSSIKSRSISIEIDKMVGLWYFFFIIITFMIVIGVSVDFTKKIIENVPSTINCEVQCFQIISILGSLAILGLLGYIATIFWRELDEKIVISGNHQEAISNEFVTENSVENMSRSVESGDWETAKLWWEKIQDEIKHKKGKRELIIKVADIVFAPLHLESSEFQKFLIKINRTKQYTDFEIIEWNNIKQKSLQSIVEDKELRHRIEGFYKIMNDYNDASREVSREMGVIINKKFSENFNKNVDGVEFYLDAPNSGNSVNLHNCAMFEIHPLQMESPRREFGNFKLRIKTGNAVSYSEYSQLDDFDMAWKQVLEDVKMNKILLKIKKCLNDLEIENNKLMGIYSDKIEMQWNV